MAQPTKIEFTKTELETLKKMWRNPEVKIRKIAVYFRVSYTTIRRTAIQLGLGRKASRKGESENKNGWTAQDTEILMRYWKDPKVSVQDLIFKLKVRRTESGIRARAGVLKLGKKARRNKMPEKAGKIELSPWPEDMPKFEDHPDADRDRRGYRRDYRRQVNGYSRSSLDNV